jgi:hypothetical protein
MAFAALAAPIFGLIGGAMQASAMNKQADAEEKIAKWNADRYREEAAWAQGTGAVKSAEVLREGERQAAKARAAMAQGGVATDTGTPLLITREFASETAHRENVTMANARNDQRKLTDKANITEYEGKVRAEATRAQATASLLGGFAGFGKGLAGAFGGGGGGFG